MEMTPSAGVHYEPSRRRALPEGGRDPLPPALGSDEAAGAGDRNTGGDCFGETCR